MTADVARLDLKLRRRSTLGYSFGMAAYVLVVVAIYPTFKNETSLNDFTKDGSTLSALFGATGSLTSPSGWMNANVYANFLPLIVLVLTLGYGASCLAGQDEDGTLALVATLPLSRRSVLVQKVAALVLQAVPVALATLVLTLVGRSFDLTLGVGDVVGATVGALLLGVDLGLLALLAGALTGSRGTALGIASAVAAASYLVSSLAPVIQWLRPLRFGSLFYWSTGNGQLDNGLTVGSIAVLVGTAVVLTATAAWAFDRLDVH